MSTNGANIKSLINQFVRNYPIEAFRNMALNRILLLLADLADNGGGSGGGGTPFVIPLTSANFVNTTDCPITSFAGSNISVFWNEANRFLNKDQGEWQDLPGGGFRVLMLNFDSTKGTYHFVAMLDGIGSQVLMVPVTSANFTDTIDCPISILAGRNIAVFFNENSKFLQKDAGEWDDLAGGGFKVKLANFDSTKANYHFYVYVL